MKDVCVVVLAAGKGTRMNGNLPKVLYEIADKPLIYWPLQLIKHVGLEPAIVVSGYKAKKVEDIVRGFDFKVNFVRQKKRLGTAHSLSVGLKLVPEDCKTILVLYSDDSVLYKPETIINFVKYHKSKKNKATFLTLERKKPTDIGALKIDNNGNVIEVMTLSMIIKENLPKHQILCGAFCFDKEWIVKRLPLIQKSNLSCEYPLPGIIKVAIQENEHVGTYKVVDHNQWRGINSPEDLKEADRLKMKQLS